MLGLQSLELISFVAVAERRSFTKAAAQVGVSLPTMSQTIRALETRLGVRLFNRTTRSVALTEAGERFFAQIQPALLEIDKAVRSVQELNETPSGRLRLLSTRPAAAALMASLIPSFLAQYPAIQLEVDVDDGRHDVVRDGYDAGIRLGHRIEQDMVVLRLTNDMRLATVASPAYLAHHARPQSPDDLLGHNCIRYRSIYDETMAPWTFAKGNRKVEVPVKGSLIVNDVGLLLRAALSGSGIAYISELMVTPFVLTGQLDVLLADWLGHMSGLFIYHPSRQQVPLPLRTFLDFIRKWEALSLPSQVTPFE